MNRMRVLLIWAISQIAFMLIIAEIALRVFFPIAVSPSYGFVPDNPYIYDPAIGWRHQPGNYTYNHPEFETRFHINSAGFRGDEPSYNGIAFLGDSFVQALQVDNRDTFVSLSDGDNYGISNTGPPHYLAIYRNFARAYHPQTVVITILLKNDIRNSSPAMANKPELMPHYKYDDTGDILNITRFGNHTELVKATNQTLLIDSAISRFVLWQASKRTFDTQAGVTQDALSYEADWNEDYKIAWFHFKWSLLTLIDEIKADGSRPVVMLIPSRWESDNQSFALLEDRYSGDSWLFQDKPRLMLSELMRESGVEYLDLTDTFRARYQNDILLHFAVDGHLTEAGHWLVAQRLKRVL